MVANSATPGSGRSGPPSIQPWWTFRSELGSKLFGEKWVFPKIRVPQNGWFIMENPIKMDDLGVPLFSETSKLGDTSRELTPFGMISSP